MKLLRMLALPLLLWGVAYANEASELPGTGEVSPARKGDQAADAEPNKSLSAPPSACAVLCSSFRTIRQHLRDTYKLGEPELYLPVYTYHMRFAYSKEKINTYQEKPLGLGLGFGRWNEYGNRESLFFFAFQDSHFKPEYTLAYAWDAIWGSSQGFHGGLGYVAGFTSRSDILSYAPFPVLVPALTFGYHRLNFRSIYVPGGFGWGNVVFSYVRWDF